MKTDMTVNQLTAKIIEDAQLRDQYDTNEYLSRPRYSSTSIILATEAERRRQIENLLATPSGEFHIAIEVDDGGNIGHAVEYLFARPAIYVSVGVAVPLDEAVKALRAAIYYLEKDWAKLHQEAQRRDCEFGAR